MPGALEVMRGRMKEAGREQPSLFFRARWAVIPIFLDDRDVHGLCLY